MTGTLSADFSAVLSDLRRRALAPLPPSAARDAGAVYLAAMRERYRRYAAGGGDWAPLTEGTKRGKAAAGYDPDAIDVRTGRLLGSLTPGDADNVLEPTPEGVTCGTAVPYGAAVNAVRPFLADPDADTAADIAAAFARGLFR